MESHELIQFGDVFSKDAEGFEMEAYPSGFYRLTTSVLARGWPGFQKTCGWRPEKILGSTGSFEEIKTK